MTWIEDIVLDHLREVTDLPDFRGTRFELPEPVLRTPDWSLYAVRGVTSKSVLHLRVSADPVGGAEPVEQMRHEAGLLKRLHDPAIPRLIEDGTLADGRYYHLLDSHLRSTPRPLSFADHAIEDLIRIFLAVARAIDSAHKLQIAHGALAAADILVGSPSEVTVVGWTGGPGAGPQRADLRDIGRVFADVAHQRAGPASAAFRAICSKAQADASAGGYPDVAALRKEVLALRRRLRLRSLLRPLR